LKYSRFLITISLFFFMFIGNLTIAQDNISPKIKANHNKNNAAKIQIQNRKKNPTQSKKFVDLKGDSIDDRIQKNLEGADKIKNSNKVKGRQGQNMDRFIDLDNDGICDGKESIIGLKRMRHKRWRWRRRGN